MIDKLIGPVTGLLDKFIEDKDQKAALAHEIATMSSKHAQQLALAQISVNAAEAASGSLFKGGWRPFIGWTCGLAFFYHFVGQPVAVFVMTVSGTEIPTLPEFDMGTLLTVLGGMLGIGGLRTYEKQKGITK
jgi:phenylpyruvate tautomerase PptA (4-oxalocrotonate tautomerase family)